MSDRYLRQMIIEGWDQSKLYNSSVAVVGSGPVAISTLVALSMLGVGDIDIYSNRILKQYDPSEFLYFGEEPGVYKVDALERIMKKSNPDLEGNITNLKMGVTWNFLSDSELILMDKSAGKTRYNLVVDATNNPSIESLMLQYGISRMVPIINASAMAYKGEVKVVTPDGKEISRGALSTEYAYKPQDPVMAGLIGGLVGEEARRLLMPLKGESIEDIDVNLNFLSRKIVGQEDDYENLNPDYRKSVLVVGAGSLGVNVVRELVQRGVKKIWLYDADRVEELNLNRQYEYTLADSVGQPKALMLKEVASQYNPAVQIIAKNEFFTGEFKSALPDAIFRCTDSFKTSAMLNATAHKYNIPLFYAATSKDDGQAYAVIPGKTPGLDDIFDVNKAAEEEIVPAGCVEEPTPSVGTVNMIMSSAMVGLFDIWCAGAEVPRGYLNYSNKEFNRFSFVETNFKTAQNKGV
ncbi:TPA: hypothetical protein HA239_00680 [Candidatus Woesearchaeota archaeon]|nr:Dinucleotide-utilizing enzyme possibly involved in molybdopterin or thiamin biosynthesis [archaeon GW2011_AR15]HIH40912.1 hypothetical protein [Candidatus Woesearchaeota archaeon]